MEANPKDLFGELNHIIYMKVRNVTVIVVENGNSNMISNP